MRVRAVLAFVWFAAACGSARPAADEPRVRAASGSGTRDATPARFTLPVPACTQALEFVRVPGTPPLWISTTEVTWDMFDVYVYKTDVEHADARVDAVTRPSQPYNPMDRGFGHAGYPALSMSLRGAQGFCAWLAAHTGAPVRLPAEPEWERAARAGDERERPDDEQLTRQAWLADDGGARTRPVATRAPNALGLHDVFGNAGEWCLAPDGTGVLRGGTYLTPRAELRYDSRWPASPAWNRRDPQVPKSVWWLIDGGFAGFRVVCDEPPAEWSTERAP